MIKQCYFSESLTQFKPDFFKLWPLAEYNNNTASAVFVGAYSGQDIEIINSHKGFKVVLICGADSGNVPRLKNCKFLVENPSMIPVLKNYGINPHLIAIKDFRNIEATPLGDKIYYYLRRDDDGCRKHFDYPLFQKLVDYFGEDKFIIGLQGHSMEWVTENYYKKCFINLQFNPTAGSTSALELACLGRQTISNMPEGFCLPYKDINDIIKHIKFEERLAGQNYINTELSEITKSSLNFNPEWLNLSFWK